MVAIESVVKFWNSSIYKIEVHALIRVRNVHARKRRHQDLSGEDHAEQAGVDVPDLAFGKIDEQYLFVIHHVAEVERRLWLADDRPHVVIRDEVIELGRDVRRHVRKRRFAAGLHRLLFPKVDDDGIMDARELARAVSRCR